MRKVGLGVVATGLLAGGLALAAVSLAGGQHTRPRHVDVKAASGQVRAAQGSWCYASRRSFQCADYMYPLRVKGRLAVAPGERIRLRMHDRTIRRLSASLLSVRNGKIERRGAVEFRRGKRNPRAWRGKIPAGAENANRLEVNVTYKRNRGDSNWWAGIRLVEPE